MPSQDRKRQKLNVLFLKAQQLKSFTRSIFSLVENNSCVLHVLNLLKKKWGYEPLIKGNHMQDDVSQGLFNKLRE